MNRNSFDSFDLILLFILFYFPFISIRSLFWIFPFTLIPLTILCNCIKRKCLHQTRATSFWTESSIELSQHLIENFSNESNFPFFSISLLHFCFLCNFFVCVFLFISICITMRFHCKKSLRSVFDGIKVYAHECNTVSHAQQN